MAGPTSAAVVSAKVNATTTADTCVGYITSADLTMDGKSVDVTSFDCSGGPTWTMTKQTIKSAKMTLKGFLDRTDAGQVILFAEWAGQLGTMHAMLTFGSGTTYNLEGPMAVDTIAISEKASGGLVEVTYTLSSNGSMTLT